MSDNGTRESLTRGQKRFVSAALGAPSIRDAAKSAEISERTAWRYLSEAHVKRALGQRLQAVTRQVMMGLASDCEDARAVLRDVMLDEEAPAGVRVRAAGKILDSTLQVAELIDLADRVAELEQHLEVRT